MAGELSFYSTAFQERFKSKYPKHYEDLEGCDRFDFYFGKWKDA
ncbi:MAG: hypothetical protein P8I55_02255 [Crocinitomix sp.]|nr:hypothetical protein [Crocinitomix sp.]